MHNHGAIMEDIKKRKRAFRSISGRAEELQTQTDKDIIYFIFCRRLLNG